MNNSYCRKYILGFCDKIKMDDTLSHHGILGMSWGKRFGPPYPLGGVDKTVARAEAKRKKENEKRIAKLQKARKKAAKLKAKAEKKERKRLEEEEKNLAIKEKLLKKDNYKQIMKNSKYFTNEELAYLKERHEKQIADRMDRFINKAAKITTAVNTISNVAIGIKQIQGLNQQSKLNDLELKSKEIQNMLNKYNADKTRIERDQKQMDLKTKKLDYKAAEQQFKWMKDDRPIERQQKVAALLDANMKAYAQRSAAAIAEGKAAEQAVKTMGMILDYEGTRNVRLQDIPSSRTYGNGPSLYNTRPTGWFGGGRGYQDWPITTITPFGGGGGKK